MNFSFYVEDDIIRVKFVRFRELGRMDRGRQRVGGLYRDRVIRLPKTELRTANRAGLLHELGHYLYQRADLSVNDLTEEDFCDGFTWLPHILTDPRNDDLRAFLGLETA